MSTFIFDAWAGKTPEELKDDCRRLSRALREWQIIAICLAEGEEILPSQREKLQNLVAAYED